MRKLYKLLSFVLFLFLFSCYNSRIPNEVVNYIEHEDDNLCQLEGVEFENKDTRLIYWECRLRIMDQRIAGEFDNYGYDLFYRREFKRLRRIIKNKIKEQKKIIITEINNSIEEKEHNYCIMSKNENKNMQDYDYFKCRKSLAVVRQKNFSNLDNKDAMELYGFTKKSNGKISSVIFVHKDCVKYAKDGEKLKQCEDAVEKANQCKANVEKTIINRRIDDKIFCTKVSLNKYPDSLAKFNNTEADNVSFGPKMEKLNIVDLREKEYKNCYKERMSKILNYRDYLEDQCRVQSFKALEEKS